MPRSGAGGLGRRDLLRYAVAGAAGAAGAAAAQEPAPEKVTAEEIATATRLSGRAYGSRERELMAKGVAENRRDLSAVRAVDPGERVDPATLFTPLLPGTRPPAGRSGFRLSAGAPRKRPDDLEQLAFATVADLARMIRTRRITSTELTRMYLGRLKHLGPKLLCVVTLTEELALKQAARADAEIARGRYRGPLHGIPWGAKDLLATRGIPTTWGAKPYQRQVFDYDATVVQRLEAAGAVLVAKLTMGELAMGDVWFGGMTRSPWDLKEGSSGSSAGSGSATAAGLVGFGIGTETLGSIVSPSVRNGVTGLRPTFGRVPRYGAMALCWTMDKIGPMCRGVEDCAAVLAAIHGPDGRDGAAVAAPFRWDPRSPLSALRLGIDEEAFTAVPRGPRREVYAQVRKVIENMGVSLRPVRLPKETPAYRPLAWLTIQVESAAAFTRLTESGEVAQLAQQGDEDWPNIFRVGATVPAVDYVHALRLRRRLQQEMAEALKEVDVFVTVPFSGPEIYYTNLTGHPALVTRCGMLDGKPVSIQFVGNLFREDAVLRLGYEYEQATEWHRQWPDTSRLA